MMATFTIKLVAICEAYFTFDEFAELAQMFEVQIDAEGRWLSVCREVTARLEYGTTRAFVDSLLDLADRRNADGVAHQTWGRRDFHVGMTSVLAEARDLLSGSVAPSEVTVGAGSTFTARSKVRDLVATAQTDLLLIGGSLKDAGKKPFNCIEVVDKAGLVADLENRWVDAAPFP